MLEIDYKEMLNMFKIDFEMCVNFIIKEFLFREKWEKDNLYVRVLEKNKNNILFVFYDGFLYVNGSIYIGYVLNKILKDIIVCYKLMCGFYFLYVFGWDIYGLLIELKMFIDVKINYKVILFIELRKRVLEYVDI